MFLLHQAGLVTAFSHAPLILAPINPLQDPPSIVLPIHQELSEIPWHVQYIFSLNPFTKKPCHCCYFPPPFSLPIFVFEWVCLCVVCIVQREVGGERTGW